MRRHFPHKTTKLNKRHKIFRQETSVMKINIKPFSPKRQMRVLPMLASAAFALLMLAARVRGFAGRKRRRRSYRRRRKRVRAEPTPFGMGAVDRGAYRMGPAADDSVWGVKGNPRGVSVDAFRMDETEITNSKYKQFVLPGAGFRQSANASPTPLSEATRLSKSKRTRRATRSSLTSTGTSRFLGATQTRMS